MDLAIQLCSYLIGVPLELFTISAMLHGGYRRYPLAFAYVIATFLTTVLEMPSSVAYYRNPSAQSARDYAWWYWRDEVVLQILVFAVVISLIYYATARLGPRKIVRLAVIAGAFLFAGVSFLLHYHPVAGMPYVWATAWTRDLKFCAAILDLALWAMLIGAREKDNQLLLVACALGIMFAGEAIGESLRNLASANQTHVVSIVGGILVQLSDIGFLYIWWRAFQPKTAMVAEKGAVCPPAAPTH